MQPFEVPYSTSTWKTLRGRSFSSQLSGARLRTLQARRHREEHCTASLSRGQGRADSRYGGSGSRQALSGLREHSRGRTPCAPIFRGKYFAASRVDAHRAGARRAPLHLGESISRLANSMRPRAGEAMRPTFRGKHLRGFVAWRLRDWMRTVRAHAVAPQLTRQRRRRIGLRTAQTNMWHPENRYDDRATRRRRSDFERARQTANRRPDGRTGAAPDERVCRRRG